MDIFKDDSDYLHFLEYIKMIRDKHPFKIHSLCLMTNHFHIVIETGDYAIWYTMQKITSLYAGYFNFRYNFTGHLFEGRYTSKIIEDEKYFLEVSRYVHLNPVKAKMVKDPIDYAYSSYALFAAEDFSMENVNEDVSKKEMIKRMMAELVDTKRVLGLFKNNSKELYRKFVDDKISHLEHEQMIQKDMKEDDMWIPR